MRLLEVANCDIKLGSDHNRLGFWYTTTMPRRAERTKTNAARGAATVVLMCFPLYADSRDTIVESVTECIRHTEADARHRRHASS